MNRYFGKHQGGAGKESQSQNSTGDTEEYSQEEIAEAAIEINSAPLVETKEKTLLKAANLPEEQQGEGVPSETFYAADESYSDRVHKDKKHKSEKRAKLSGFSRFLIIYATVFLIIVAIGLVFFWKYIAAYEVSRPEHEMDAFSLAMDTVDGSSALEANFQVSEFEDKDVVFNDIYSTYIQGQSCSFRKMPGEYTDDSPVYIFRAGTTDLFKVSLRAKGENAAGYGFQLWEVSTIELLKDNTRTVTIEAPPSAAVSVNGIAVSADYITDDHVEYENLSEQEIRFNADFDAYRVLYSIENVYGEVTVSAVDEEGAELTAEASDGSEFVYDATRYAVKITAPSDAVLTLNGIELGEEDVNGTLFSQELFAGLEKYATAVPDFAIYEVDGLFAEPVITATDASGAELSSEESADGEIVYGLTDSEKLKEAHTQLVTDFIKAYVTFSTDVGDDTNGNYSRLSKYLLTNTETYKRIKNSIEGISWVTGGTIEYRELTADNFISCGDNCFVCRVSLGITDTVDGNVRDTDSVYTLVFVRSGGSWLVGNMLAS